MIHGCSAIRTANDGAAAIAAIEAEPVDLLITDVRMPIMDGITLVQRLKEMGLGVPSIVFVSGFADVNFRDMYDLGVTAFLAKPMARNEFIASAERAIADRRDLWLLPMDPPPRQFIDFDSEKCAPASPGEHRATNCLSLGRGGFCTHIAAPLGLGVVAFNCRLSANEANGQPERVLAGQGFVRWFSKMEQVVGIEFAYLEPSCRAWVIHQIAAIAPRSFIPYS